MREILKGGRVALTLSLLGDGGGVEFSTIKVPFCFISLSSFFLAKNNLMLLVSTTLGLVLLCWLGLFTVLVLASGLAWFVISCIVVWFCFVLVSGGGISCKSFF